MVVTKEISAKDKTTSTRTKRRRLRRLKLTQLKPEATLEQIAVPSDDNSVASSTCNLSNNNIGITKHSADNSAGTDINKPKNMSSTGDTKSRQDVLAAREAKKLAKQKAKNKDNAEKESTLKQNVSRDEENMTKEAKPIKFTKDEPKDEVDRAIVKDRPLQSEEAASEGEKSKDQIMVERAAKKAAKQAKKKGPTDKIESNPDMTVKDVVQTLKDIKTVAKDIQDITAKVSAIQLQTKKEANVPITKSSDEGKSKAELKAERRAKQEAQRAAKQAAAVEQKVAAEKPKETKSKLESGAKPVGNVVKEKSPKLKTEKSKLKLSSANRVNWFQHLYAEHDKVALKNIPVNSNLHPAIIKLGVQLASRVVCGSNARCIALLDALKKMVKDYILPAKTEFARGLESHLTASLDFLWSMRQPSASQTNAIKYFRHHLTQLPNNIDEFDAKKILQEEIDNYIEDQIDKAGEAISMTVQKKISTGDNILTYGYSSLIERILVEAWAAGLRFRVVVVGARHHADRTHLLRRLTAKGLPCVYGDITAINFLMKDIDKVILGASAVLVNGSVLCRAGAVGVALCARAHNVPALVAAETHKFCDRVQADAFVYNELGDPDALIDPNDENSPLKEWRSNPNLTPLNLTYDVTPASLVTAVVTEKAILPCTSAPVVLRTKLVEYGM